MPITDLILSVQPDTDVLHRVVCVCHRRRLVITALSYRAGRLRLTVDGRKGQAERIGIWLAGLPSVLSVAEINTVSGGRGSAGSGRQLDASPHMKPACAAPRTLPPRGPT
jgi:hypothetical protein